MSVNPKAPLRADHRFLKKVLAISLGGKVEHVPAELDRISQVFQKAGGRWSRLFQGSPRDFHLLRKVVKVAYDKGYLTKKYKWGA